MFTYTNFASQNSELRNFASKSRSFKVADFPPIYLENALFKKNEISLVWSGFSATAKVFAEPLLIDVVFEFTSISPWGKWIGVLVGKYNTAALCMNLESTGLEFASVTDP